MAKEFYASGTFTCTGYFYVEAETAEEAAEKFKNGEAYFEEDYFTGDEQIYGEWKENR